MKKHLENLMDYAVQCMINGALDSEGSGDIAWHINGDSLIINTYHEKDGSCSIWREFAKVGRRVKVYGCNPQHIPSLEAEYDALVNLERLARLSAIKARRDIKKFLQGPESHPYVKLIENLVEAMDFGAVDENGPGNPEWAMKGGLLQVKTAYRNPEHDFEEWLECRRVLGGIAVSEQSSGKTSDTRQTILNLALNDSQLRHAAQQAERIHYERLSHK